MNLWESVMALEVAAIYEDGVLRPDHHLPLSEHQRVKVTVEEETSHSQPQLWSVGLDRRS